MTTEKKNMKLICSFAQRFEQVEGSSTRLIVACLLVAICFSFASDGRAQNRTDIRIRAAIPSIGTSRQSSFTPTSSMNRPRESHTATLLQDGRVLVAGGRDGNSLDSAELYDPATGTFVLTGRMLWPRSGHTAILLPNGKVLMAGGGNTADFNLELYDPATGVFAKTGDTVEGRPLSNGILLNNGKVLLAGAPGQALLYDPSTAAITPTGNPLLSWDDKANLFDGRVLMLGYIQTQLYDPVSGSFTLAGSLSIGGSGAKATTLRNGQVLVTGGEEPDDVFDRAELYDPVSGTFSRTSNMNDHRLSHTSTLLPDGSVLIAGGQSWYGARHRSAELYDPATGIFTRTADMTVEHASHTATLLNNGRVLITGGILPGTVMRQATAEVYEPRPETGPVAINGSFDPATVRLGGSFTTTFTGINLTDKTYFDVRFLSPGSSREQEALNWQQGPSASHSVPIDTAPGRWVITGVRAHQSLEDHNSEYCLVSLTVTLSLVVTDLRFDATSVRAGGSFTATFSGTNLNSETYFDVRFRGPGIDTEQVALNWQRGESINHDVPIDTAIGVWTITGISPHQNANDHSTDFAPVSVSIAVTSPLSRGSVSRTGDMSVARTNHTATLLPDGKVLIAGGGTGSQASQYLASAELYDPSTGKFSPTGSMNRPRVGHSATLLTNGKVLIAGGGGGASPVTLAELYDPATGTFVPTGPMVMVRLSHTATLVSGGKVLIAGGPPQSELYDPATGTFELAAPPTGPGHPLLGGMVIPSATVLSDGTVLLSGPSSEIYDPTSGTFTRAGNLAFPSFGHTATLLPDGKVLVAGGVWEDDGVLARAELYDPATRTFTRNGNMTTNRNSHTATLLRDRAVLITGGDDGRCSFVPPPCSGGTLSSYELYDPVMGTFAVGGAMTTERQGHTATVLNDGRVLLTGGTNATAELYEDRSR
jgi:hypothetical protein